MRPTSRRQGFLRAPMNDVLGSESAVRIVRALALSKEPLARRELQRRTLLHAAGLPKSLTRLEEAGVIESVGVGRERPYRMRAQFTLTAKLVELFRAESERSTQVLDRIRQMVWQLNPTPDAAWIEGKVADATDGPNDPIVIGILVATETPEWATHLRAVSNGIQRAFDVQVETRLWRRSDLAATTEDEVRRLASASPLLGLAPLELAGHRAAESSMSHQKTARSQEEHDAIGLGIGRAVAEALRKNPELQIRAREFVESQLAVRSAGVRLDIEEWKDILSDYSLARLRAFLISPSERATRLRQSLPFAAVFSDEERERIRTRAEALR